MSGQRFGSSLCLLQMRLLVGILGAANVVPFSGTLFSGYMPRHYIRRPNRRVSTLQQRSLDAVFLLL